MTTRVQKMTRVLIYAYFNPSCVKAVGGGGGGAEGVFRSSIMYKFIILIK